MKCPVCSGNGSVPYPIDYEQGLFDETNCDLCGGSGEVLTNEEWFCDYFNNEFRSMPTEKKAELIADFILRLEELNCNKRAWEKWLKEKHTE